MPQRSQPITPLKRATIYSAIVMLLFGLFPPATGILEARVDIKPGFNTFSPEQDVQIGQEAVREVEKQLPIVSDGQLSEYVNRIGQRLARFAPGHKFPYRFGLINAKDINAFALPGGPVYLHTGILLAANNEAQLAGVLAHEISHIALRHSTNQASKAMLAQAPLSILGGILSGGGLAGELANLGIAFGINSVFLKFSRGAERQADDLGAQIMYDAGYDPRAMAQFFEVIQKESGSRAVEFLSSHPNPGNRQRDVSQLIPSLGPARGYETDSPEFQQMKQRVSGLRAGAPSMPADRGAVGPTRLPPEPSRRFRSVNAGSFSLSYPENWQIYGDGSSTLTIVPPEGVFRSSEGATPVIGYGALVSFFEPAGNGRRVSLSNATDQLVRELQRSNPNLRVTARPRGARLAGQEALLVSAVGESPLPGEREVNWIATSFRPEGLWFIVFIAPERSWNAFEPAFRQMLDSVSFPR